MRGMVRMALCLRSVEFYGTILYCEARSVEIGKNVVTFRFVRQHTRVSLVVAQNQLAVSKSSNKAVERGLTFTYSMNKVVTVYTDTDISRVSQLYSCYSPTTRKYKKELKNKNKN